MHFIVIYAFDQPEEQLNILNVILGSCIEKHSPLKRTKITSPPAPWIKSPEILELKEMFANTRSERFNNNTEINSVYRKVKLALKKGIKIVKKHFYLKALFEKPERSTVYHP